MLADLYANGCILFFHLFLLKRLFENNPVSFSSRLRLKLLYGAAYGGMGAIQLLFSMKLGLVQVDLRFIPIMLVSLYGGLTASAMAGVLIGIARIIIFGVNPPALFGAIVVIGMGLVCGGLSYLRIGIWVKWLLSTTFCCLTTYAVVSYFTDDPARLRKFFFDYALACYILSALILRFQMYLRNMTRYYNKLDKLSKIDEMTGVYNYRYFREQFDLLLADKGKRRERFSLFLIQCEDLKTLNMELGFGRVNDLLAAMAEELRRLFPNRQMIARAAGAQFFILTREQEGQAVAEWQDVPPEKRSLYADGVLVPITVCGVVESEEERTAEEIMFYLEDRLQVLKKEEQRGRDEQLIRSEKLRAVGEMAAGMAHEIRNPLTIVRGFLQLAKQSGDFIRVYDMIMHEVGRMNDLTKEFLQFAKPKKSQLRTIQLDSIIRKAVQLVESESISQGHSLLCEIQDPDVMVTVDEDKLVQVLLNLARNAMEAMEGGGRLTIRGLANEQSSACIEVEDTGSGIPVDMLDRIFDPFFSTKEEGTGLGLSICQKIMQDHQGTLEVSSIVGEGTVFTMILPLKTGEYVQVEAKR